MADLAPPPNPGRIPLPALISAALNYLPAALARPRGLGGGADHPGSVPGSGGSRHPGTENTRRTTSHLVLSQLVASCLLPAFCPRAAHPANPGKPISRAFLPPAIFSAARRKASRDSQQRLVTGSTKDVAAR